MAHPGSPVAVHRTVVRAARPALAPLRAAAAGVARSAPAVPTWSGPVAATLTRAGATLLGAAAHRAEATVAVAGRALRVRSTARGELVAAPAEPDELVALRDAGRDVGDPADRATRSAAAYLEARRVRLRRELDEAS